MRTFLIVCGVLIGLLVLGSLCSAAGQLQQYSALGREQQQVDKGLEAIGKQADAIGKQADTIGKQADVQATLVAVVVEQNRASQDYMTVVLAVVVVAFLLIMLAMTLNRKRTP